MNDDWKSKAVKVQDILDICEKAADVNRDLAAKIIAGETNDVAAFTAYAWFIQEERKYRYDIPEVIREAVKADKDGDTND